MPTTKIRERPRFNAEVRREQILNEAIRIIGECGYNGFSIQELAQRCQLTNAGLLYHFGSKDQLLIALLQDRDRRDTVSLTSMTELASYHAAHGDTSMKTVLKLLRAIVQRNSEQPELVRLYTALHAEALNETHPARDYFAQREMATIDAFAQMIGAHVEQPRSTARQLLALMSGLEAQWLRVGQSFDLVAEWDLGVAKLL